MIDLHTDQNGMTIDMAGSDRLILEELSAASVRILSALGRDSGFSVRENLTALVLILIEKSEQPEEKTR